MPDIWLPVTQQNLEIEAGSPLDFSTFLLNPAITEERRLILNPDGHIALQGNPSAPYRLLCGTIGNIPDNATADKMAVQLRRHGYNCVRFHFLDIALMEGQLQDFEYRQDILDRFRYYMAALKQNGIYWIVDGLTSNGGALGGVTDRWGTEGRLKLKTHVENAAFGHWLRFQVDIFGTVNPYTGLVPFEDPAMAVVVPFNENGLSFNSWIYANGDLQGLTELRVPFNQWLRERYSTTAALANAWGSELALNENLENSTVILPANRYAGTARLRDFARFLVDIETRTMERMSDCIRAMGFKGVVAPYNNWTGIQPALTRSNQAGVAMNTYHDWIGDMSPGGQIEQNSSLANAVEYFRLAASARHFGKPFVMTEYDHLFWNRFRYEAGLAMPSYAAFQGWDVLCRHSNGALVLGYGGSDFNEQYIRPYRTALDPIARAGETLAALLFRRGDVAKAAHQIVAQVQDVSNLVGLDTQEPDAVTIMSLMTGFAQGDAAQAPGAVLVGSPRQINSQAAAITFLRNSGVLAVDNLSDAASGIYASDTGEIMLDIAAKQMRVVTPHTEAVAFASVTQAISLGQMTVWNASGASLFAVSSLDGQTVAQSSKLLIIMATNARNTGMTFSDTEQKIVSNYGALPVEIKVEWVQFSLSTDRPWRISPINLDGGVQPQVVSGDGTSPIGVELWSNVSSLPVPPGPTTYFLLERL
ncbi:glycoside hydrolase [Ochrobactrum sp. POC9]|uniref:glycoside hydrolase n=1 Tax=unclassified Ochrobactrum TaxID=239106 RepID=UPI000D70577C|nr:glycoside hydrolase [Ochrobactrum sp. POC9]MCH4540034.1 glycoside hydrolase [Ochrobactrum sp. A-1]PWU77020.1 glycoside hydrolase [Ochrobactrum sp. POC9]